VFQQKVLQLLMTVYYIQLGLKITVSISNFLRSSQCLYVTILMQWRSFTFHKRPFNTTRQNYKLHYKTVYYAH